MCCGFCLFATSCPSLGETCLTFGKHCTVKEIETCGQGREDKGKESKAIELCIDTGFLAACVALPAFSKIAVYVNGRQISFSIQFLLQSGCFCVSDSGSETES